MGPEEKTEFLAFYEEQRAKHDGRFNANERLLEYCIQDTRVSDFLCTP